MKKVNFHVMIATCLGLGYSPIAPGTAGSLAGALICFLSRNNFGLFIFLFLALFTIGVMSSGKAEEFFGDKDPSAVVIDELACIFAAYLFIPITVPVLAVGFLIYRAADIVKPPPANLLERVPGGWGIMLDDLAAGVYTNIALRGLMLIGLL